MREIEHNLQVACVRWFRMQYPYLTLIAIPNGGARSIVTAGKMKAEGVLAGAPDLFLFLPSAPYHGLCIEMKTATGRQSSAQKQFQAHMNNVGYKYVVCRSVEEFMQEVRNYLRYNGEVYL